MSTLFQEGGNAGPRRVTMLFYPQAQLLDVAGPVEVFARTARYVRDTLGVTIPPYEVELVAKDAGPVATSSGVEVVAARSFRDLDRADTLLIAGGIGFAHAMTDEETIDLIVRQAGTARRVASVCTGAFLIAAAGLLRGREATTHWAYCDRLAAFEPGCRVNADAIFVKDDAIYSSAGVTAGMDLALALVEEDLGAPIALAVAQELVMYVKRPGGQAQFSRQLEAQRRDQPFGALHLWMLEHLHLPISVEDLAAQMGMSARHFARRFGAVIGRSPAAYLAQLRVEHARQRIEQGERSLKDVARSSGFADEQAMRRAFLRELRVTPSDYAARFAR